MKKTKPKNDKTLPLPDVQQSVYEGKHNLAIVRRRLESLCTAIMRDQGEAFFQQGKSMPITGTDARAATCAQLNELYRDPASLQEGYVKPDDCFMALASSTKTQEEALALNEAKEAFCKWHEVIRYGRPQQAATDFFRHQVLKAMKERDLDVEAVDRKVQVLTDDTKKIRWFYNISAPTKKRNIEDAIALLKEWKKNTSDLRREKLSSEVDRLVAMGDMTPVSQRLRNPIKSLRYRAICFDEHDQKHTPWGYGRNPILYPDRKMTPVLVLPKEITGEVTIEKSGRPKKLQDDPLSPYLKDWFLYK